MCHFSILNCVLFGTMENSRFAQDVSMQSGKTQAPSCIHTKVFAHDLKHFAVKCRKRENEPQMQCPCTPWHLVSVSSVTARVSHTLFAPSQKVTLRVWYSSSLLLDLFLSLGRYILKIF